MAVRRTAAVDPRGAVRRAVRRRTRREGRRDARGARGVRRGATAAGRRRGRRARLLPHRARRVRARPRLRVRPRVGDAVRVGAADRGRRALAAVPDARCRLGRLVRRVPAAPEAAVGRARGAGGVRRRVRLRVRPRPQSVVLAVRHQRVVVAGVRTGRVARDEPPALLGVPRLVVAGFRCGPCGEQRRAAARRRAPGPRGVAPRGAARGVRCGCGVLGRSRRARDVGILAMVRTVCVPNLAKITRSRRP